MKCQSCGHEVPDDLIFCKYCGERLLNTIPPYQTNNNINFDKTQSMDSDNDKTVVDSDSSNTVLNNNFEIEDSDRTIITKNNEPVEIQDPLLYSNKVQNRKLIGWLVTYDLDPNGVDYKLYEGRNRVGRKDENDIVIKNNSVSEPHALILYRDGKIIIEDSLSTNGTFINGDSIAEKTLLKDNDEVKFGEIKFKLKVI